MADEAAAVAQQQLQLELERERLAHEAALEVRHPLSLWRLSASPHVWTAPLWWRLVAADRFPFSVDVAWTARTLRLSPTTRDGTRHLIHLASPHPPTHPPEPHPVTSTRPHLTLTSPPFNRQLPPLSLSSPRLSLLSSSLSSPSSCCCCC